MIDFISHRGNMRGPNPARENAPDYIDEAIVAGFQVEVDLRRIGSDWFLGHDFPQYQVDKKWLDERKGDLLLHLKDFNSLKYKDKSWHFFCHSNDPFTFTSQGYRWLHDLSLTPDEFTIVPLMTLELIAAFEQRRIHAICSDFRVSEDGRSVYNVPRGTT
jgi:hypothetical protein